MKCWLASYEEKQRVNNEIVLNGDTYVLKAVAEVQRLRMITELEAQVSYTEGFLKGIKDLESLTITQVDAEGFLRGCMHCLQVLNGLEKQINE